MFDEICGHISTYISSQLNLADVKFNISPIQTQMEGPLILEPNIFQICWRIGSRFLSNLHIFRLSNLFCDQPSLIWFSNLPISISQLNHFVCCYFINLSKINVCRRILLAPSDIGIQNWPHCSVSDFSPLILHCQRSWLSSWQHVVTIRRDQLDIT